MNLRGTLGNEEDTIGTSPINEERYQCDDSVLSTNPAQVHQNVQVPQDTTVQCRTGSFDKPLPAYNSKSILEEQKKDPDLLIVREWLKSEQKPDTKED